MPRSRAWLPPDRNPAPLDPVRGRLPGQPDAGHRSRALQPDDPGGSGRHGHQSRGPLDEGPVRTEPANPARHLRSRAGHRVRERRESSAGPGGRTPGANGGASSARRHAPADRGGSACGGNAAGGGGRGRRAAGGRRRCAPAGRAGIPELAVRADCDDAIARRAGFRRRTVAGHRYRFRFRARMACIADRSDRCVAWPGPQHRPTFVPLSHGAADSSVVDFRRGRRRRRSARAKSRPISNTRTSATKYRDAC